MLYNTVFNLKLLKMDQKMCVWKTLKKFGKPGKIFEKVSGNPVSSYSHEKLLMTSYITKPQFVVSKLNII